MVATSNTETSEQTAMTDDNSGSAVRTQLIELAEVKPGVPTGSTLLGDNLNLLDGVKVNLNVVLGEVHTTVGQLLGLKEASVLKVERQIDYPVDVVLNGNVIARGQLVVVDDNFGVRISEIAQSAS